MFTSCIGCSKKPVEEEEDGDQRGTPKTKEAVKSLGSQLKDMALKVTGAYKQSKPDTGSSSSSNKKEQIPYPDFETISEGVPYPYVGGSSSSSTPAFDITSSNFPGGRPDQRFMGGFNGDTSLIEPDPVSVIDVFGENYDECREWLAQDEPGVSLAFVALPNGGNDLKRIRFKRDMFDRCQAQKWWAENFDRVIELYNVRRYCHQVFNTPPRSEDEPRDSSYSRLTSGQESPRAMSLRDWTPRNRHSEANDQGSGQNLLAGSSVEPSRTTTSSRDERSISNASDIETQWIEQDEPGVYITIRQCADGTKELRRVRFSREIFGEGRAKKWWEENRDRIEAQYL